VIHILCHLPSLEILASIATLMIMLTEVVFIHEHLALLLDVTVIANL
jgi:hypothetical protein